ncbi:hypothetical protein ACQ4PT_045578 [Festuca glaucescens]
MFPLELPGEATATTPASPASPAAPPPPPPSQLPPPPFKPTRLAPQTPWFLSEEKRRLLRSSAPVSDPDQDRVLTPPASTPVRSAVATDSDSEVVPDSAPASSAPTPCEPRLDASPAGCGGQSVFIAGGRQGTSAAPGLRSLIVAPSSFLCADGLLGASRRPEAPAAQDEEGWMQASSRRRARRGGLSRQRDGGAAPPMPRCSQAQAEAARLRFRRRTDGLCARCLVPIRHHRSGACRDPFRCLTCNLSSHKERCCPLRLAASAGKQRRPRPPPSLPRHQPSSPSAPSALSWASVVAKPPPDKEPSPLRVVTNERRPVEGPSLQPPPAVVQSSIGSAAKRPVDLYDLDLDIKDWEATAAIAWPVYGKHKVDALAIARTIRKEFRLSHREFSVCPHQPMQYLVKFEQKTDCSEVLKKARVKADGALVQLRPWRRDGSLPPSPMDAPPDAGSLQSLQVGPTKSDVEFRATLVEHAASLRDVLMDCLDKAVQPLLAESAALRSWNERASLFIDHVRASPSPRPMSLARTSLLSPASLEPGAGRAAASSQLHGASDHVLGSEGNLSLPEDTAQTGRGLFDGQEGDDELSQGDGLLPDLMASLEISTGIEARHASTSPMTGTTVLRDEVLSSTPESPVAVPPVTDQVNVIIDVPVEGNLQQFLSSVAALVQPPLISMPAPKKKKKNRCCRCHRQGVAVGSLSRTRPGS